MIDTNIKACSVCPWAGGGEVSRVGAGEPASQTSVASGRGDALGSGPGNDNADIARRTAAAVTREAVEWDDRVRHSALRTCTDEYACAIVLRVGAVVVCVCVYVCVDREGETNTSLLGTPPLRHK